MGVYIKGMEMPKNCLACDWCAHTIPADNYICYRLNRAVIGVAKEDVDETVNACCPISPVPPHGRLIVFPCEVDDVLYEVDDPSFGVIVCKVYSVNYSRQRARLADDEEMMDCVSVLVKVIEGHGIGSSYSFGMEDFGKSIFLTREEAEAALAAPTIIEADGGEA